MAARVLVGTQKGAMVFRSDEGRGRWERSALLMKVLYQPALGNPGDWIQVDSSEWSSLGDFKMNAVNVQGVIFEGPDFYDVEDMPDGSVRGSGWHCDPTDWPSGQRWAREFVFYPLAPSTNPLLGGAIDTRQEHTIYAEAGILPTFQEVYASMDVRVRPWSDFNCERSSAKAGVWLSDVLYAAHQSARSAIGWRMWGEHLHADELDDHGCVTCQRSQGRYRVPQGTRTYYHNPEAGTGVQGADTTNSLALAPTTVTNLVSGNVGGNGATSFEAISPANEPDSAAWPTTGIYRYQLDVLLAGADLAFGLLPMGSQGAGGFERVDAGITTAAQLIAQEEAAFSGSGLFIASVTNPAWTAGVQTDRVGIVVAAQRVAGHGNQTFTLQVGESDDFVDGPWLAAVAAVNAPAIVFGANF